VRNEAVFGKLPNVVAIFNMWARDFLRSLAPLNTGEEKFVSLTRVQF
jgi:hypothetical protein